MKQEHEMRGAAQAVQIPLFASRPRPAPAPEPDYCELILQAHAINFCESDIEYPEGKPADGWMDMRRLCKVLDLLPSTEPRPDPFELGRWLSRLVATGRLEYRKVYLGTNSPAMGGYMGFRPETRLAQGDYCETRT